MRMSASEVGLRVRRRAASLVACMRFVSWPFLARLALHGLRGAALCFGLFVAVNWWVALRDGGIDSNIWWIDLRSLPWVVRSGGLLAVAGALVVFAWRPAVRGAARGLLVGVFAGACAWALRDAAVALAMMAEGRLGGWNVPFSTGVALFFVGVLVAVVRAPGLLARAGNADGEARAEPAGGQTHLGSNTPPRQTRHRLRRLGAMAAGAALALLLIPLGVIATFGQADYTRQALDQPGNLAVVFGAGVRADGTPSLALHDRTISGIALYTQGHAAKLFFSGGPGRGAIHETEAMTQLALANGVPQADILIDRQGLSTWDTAQHTAELVKSNPNTTILAVTHAYHIPRVELAFQMHGLDVLTVPATETRPLGRRHYYTLREVAGFWVYWGRRVLSSPASRA